MKHKKRNSRESESEWQYLRALHAQRSDLNRTCQKEKKKDTTKGVIVLEDIRDAKIFTLAAYKRA